MSLLKVRQKNEHEFKKYFLNLAYSSYKNTGGEIIERTFFQIFKKKSSNKKTTFYFLGVPVFSKRKIRIRFDEKKYLERKDYYNNLIKEIVKEIKSFKIDDSTFLQENKTEFKNYTKQISRFDPLGCILKKDGKIYRGVYPESVEYFKELYKTGILQVLSKYGLMVDTKITNFYTQDFPLILEHEKIDYIPDNFWSYSRFKDVAINQILLLKILDCFNYTLIDGHNENSGFKNNKAIQIDIGSIIKKENNSKNAISEIIISQIFTMILKNINSQTTYEFKNWPNCTNNFEFKHAINKFRKLCNKRANKILDRILIEKEIEPQDIEIIFNFNNQKTLWSDYNHWNIDTQNIIKDNSDKRFPRVCELINKYSKDAKTSLDLAGNSGFMSTLLLKNTNIKKACSTDYDENAVEYGLKIFKDNSLPIGCYLLNFMLASGIQAAVNTFKSDIVLAMAVTHHLILTQGFNIDSIFETIGSFSNKYVYIEFCPLGMYANDIKAPCNPEFYTESWFEEHFRKYFDLLHKETLATVILEGEERKHRVMFIGELKKDKEFEISIS